MAEKENQKPEKDPNSTPQRLIAEYGIYSPETPPIDKMFGKNPKEKDALVALNENMRKFLKDFTVHGSYGEIDPKTGKPALKAHSDLDGEACKEIFKLAGFNVKGFKHVEQGQKPKSGWGVDTGEVDGYEIERDGEKIILITDHHGKESGRDTSATKHLFKELKEFGFFDKMKDEQPEKLKALENFVDFVTREDNQYYNDRDLKKKYQNGHKNLAGLKSYLTVEQMIEAVEDLQKGGKKFDPVTDLDPEYIKKLKFHHFRTNRPIRYETVLKEMSDARKRSDEAIEQITEKGLFADTGRKFGKVLIDTCRFDKGSWKGKVGQRFLAAKNADYQTLCIWNPETNYFQLFTSEDIDFDLPQGHNTRGRYWLYAGDEGPLKFTLEDVLGKLSGKKDYKLDDKLKEALENDKIEKDLAVKIFDISKRKGEDVAIEKQLMTVIEDMLDLLKDYRKKTEEKVKKYKMEKEWPPEVIDNRVELHAQRLFLRVYSGKFGLKNEDGEIIIRYVLNKLRNKK